MFEGLKRNILQEKKILSDMRVLYSNMQGDTKNKEFYLKSINSLLKQIYILNKTVPELLKEWSPSQTKPAVVPLVKPLPQVVSVKKEANDIEKNKKTVDMSYVSPSKNEKHFITIDKKDRKEYLKRLNLSEKGLIDLDKTQKKKIVDDGQRKPNKYAGISNRYFRKYSEKISPAFVDVGEDLKKANLPFLLSTYLSMALFTATLGFIAGIFIYIVVLIFNPMSNWIHIWIPFASAGLVLIGFYLYPSSEAGSMQKKIVYELPFASIHMAAIAGSDIEPSKIFKIIAESKEYPNIGNEMRKVIIQTEVYGYDLVASLKNVAARTSSKRLAELFSGLATNISTGGQLKNFLEKKADNYLLDYKLERQKYADLAGTFMDVYISILIAAPLVLMMMFIVMNVAGMSMGGLGIGMLMAVSIVGIAIVNVIFLVVLNLKQPQV